LLYLSKGKESERRQRL